MNSFEITWERISESSESKEEIRRGSFFISNMDMADFKAEVLTPLCLSAGFTNSEIRDYIGELVDSRRDKKGNC